MDGNFKPDANPPIETKKEYSFDEGVDACMERINKLILENPKGSVFVVINGSSTDVGKTRLRGAIEQRLMIAAFTEFKERVVPVIISEEQGLLYTLGRNYREDFSYKPPGIEIGQVADLYIGIYRPDKPFWGKKEGKESPVADIMIRNEYAKDNLGKYQNEHKR